MAFPTRSSLFFFFLTLVLFSTQTNARGSYSFGKFHKEIPKDQNPNNDLVPIQTNEKKEQDDQNQNPDFIPQSENGYGLYGQETTYNNNNEELNNNKYDENVNYDDSFSTPSLSQNQESYKNYEENYPKTTESYANYENTDAYGRKREQAYKGYSNNVVERQGMSDTRFMANGKYYYDLDDDRNHGRFYKKHHYNYNPTGYNENDQSNFKNPYDSKNVVNQQSEMFVEEQGEQFTP